jgi:hypothetical protein
MDGVKHTTCEQAGRGSKGTHTHTHREREKVRKERDRKAHLHLLDGIAHGIKREVEVLVHVVNVVP